MSRSLAEWLSYIEKLHDRAWDPGLERVGEVGRRLEVLEPGKQTILVAGTNGKGSTCEYLEKLALKQGLSTGKSTSPHLRHFNERIVLNGVPATELEICTAFALIEDARKEISLSYFEFSTLAALVLFKRHQVDLAILEIGLGGRLDAMNIVNPNASVIMKIALDHQSWLGDSLELIGREKAGIMRAGVPCILAEEHPPASIISFALELGVPLFRCPPSFGEQGGQVYFSNSEMENLPSGHLPRESFWAAIQTLQCLNHPPTQIEANEVLLDTRLPGRFQVEQIPQTHPLLANMTKNEPLLTLIFDVAHNPDAAQRLSDKLMEKFPGRSFQAIFAVYEDKDYTAMLDTLAPLVNRWFLANIDEKRAADPEIISATLAELGELEVSTYDKVTLACAAAVDARNEYQPEGAILLVFGTFPLVAAALSYFEIPIDSFHDR
ncbi:MAG: dihydrofolate synthase/folylpolyglutamate synthase [Candidatus Azotimanducaceae bacterium]